MCPLYLCNTNEQITIGKINITDETLKQHLSGLGFVEGENISVISKNENNFILSVKGSRYALSKDIVKKVMVYKDNPVRQLVK